MGYHLEASLVNDPERGDRVLCSDFPLSRPAPDGTRRGSRGQGLVRRGGLIRLVPYAAPTKSSGSSSTTTVTTSSGGY